MAEYLSLSAGGGVGELELVNGVMVLMAALDVLGPLGLGRGEDT